jgi:hypothetical protein
MQKMNGKNHHKGKKEEPRLLLFKNIYIKNIAIVENMKTIHFYI